MGNNVTLNLTRETLTLSIEGLINQSIRCGDIREVENKGTLSNAENLIIRTKDDDYALSLNLAKVNRADRFDYAVEALRGACGSPADAKSEISKEDGR